MDNVCKDNCQKKIWFKYGNCNAHWLEKSMEFIFNIDKQKILSKNRLFTAYIGYNEELEFNDPIFEEN